jgi:uncharacterized protein YukE
MCSRTERSDVHAETNHERAEDAMAKTTKRTTERTAEEAYADHRAKIEALLATITSGVQRHAKEFSITSRKNWGFVGDLTAIENALREIAETMPQVDDADLAEHR